MSVLESELRYTPSVGLHPNLIESGSLLVTGIQPVGGTELAPFYDSPAYVPDIRTIRDFDPTEDADLIMTAYTPRSRQVELIQTDQEEVNRIAQRYINRLPVDFQNAANYARSWQAAYEAVFEKGRSIRVSITDADELTATLNPATGLLAGLHVDNRGKVPVTDFTEGNNDPLRRAIVTLAGSRAVLACFPDILTMAYELQSAGKLDDAHYRGDNVIFDRYARHFLAKIRCVAVLVEPTQALVLPTDLVGHDGTTNQLLLGGIRSMGSISIQLLEGKMPY